MFSLLVRANVGAWTVAVNRLSKDLAAHAPDAFALALADLQASGRVTTDAGQNPEQLKKILAECLAETER